MNKTEKNELENKDDYEYRGVGIIKKKDVSIFKIISKRYMIKYYGD